MSSASLLLPVVLSASAVTAVLFFSAKTAVAPIPVPTSAIVRTPATTRTIYLLFTFLSILVISCLIPPDFVFEVIFLCYEGQKVFYPSFMINQITKLSGSCF